MPLNHSPLSYADCKGAFEKALDAPKGIMITCTSSGAALHLVRRLHSFRVMTRRDSAKIYPEDHPMYGLSPYDRTIVQRKDNIVLIRPVTEDSLVVEEIQ